MTHAEVEACQVVGVQASGRPAAAAFVIPRSGAGPTEAELIAHCDGRLAKFKVPARVFVVERFPTTPSANGEKIQRNRLRETAQAALDAAEEERNPA